MLIYILLFHGKRFNPNICLGMVSIPFFLPNHSVMINIALNSFRHIISRNPWDIEFYILLTKIDGLFSTAILIITDRIPRYYSYIYCKYSHLVFRQNVFRLKGNICLRIILYDILIYPTLPFPSLFAYLHHTTRLCPTLMKHLTLN